MRKTSKKNVTTEVIKKHIYDNIKEYAIASILFIIGIILGVIFINNANDLQITQITNYLSNFSGSLKTDYEIDNSELLKNSVRDNVIEESITNFKKKRQSIYVGKTLVFTGRTEKGGNIHVFLYTISS